MTDAPGEAGTRRRMPPRTHSNFATRTARDDTERLGRRGSVLPSPSPNEETPLLPIAGTAHQSAPENHDSAQERDHGIDSMREWFSRALHSLRSERSETADQESKRPPDPVKPRPGAFPRPVGGTAKLGTFAGVFVPTTLNVLSILMFLRFGFILGQAGVLGMLGKFVTFTTRAKY